MKIGVFSKLFLAVLLASGAVSASMARPPEGGRPMPNQQGDFRQRAPDFGPPNGGGRNEMAGDQEQHRRGKLSPDERRELRRQINEVGQDIYRVKR